MRSCPEAAGTHVSPSPAGWEERHACIFCPLCSSEAPHGSPWAQIQLCAGRVPGGMARLDSFPGLLQLLEPCVPWLVVFPPPSAKSAEYPRVSCPMFSFLLLSCTRKDP